MAFATIIAVKYLQDSAGVTANSFRAAYPFRRINYASVIVPTNVIISGRIPPKKRKGKAVIVIRSQLKLPLAFLYWSLFSLLAQFGSLATLLKGFTSYEFLPKECLPPLCLEFFVLNFVW